MSRMSPRTPRGGTPGRPPLEDPRRHVDSVRTSDAERDLLLAGAAADGAPLGPWIRDAALKAARRAVARQRRRTATDTQDGP